MSLDSSRDIQLAAIWADQQAMEIVLRAMLKSTASRGPAAQAELMALIDAETDRFHGMSNEPGWDSAVLAVVASIVEDLRSDHASRATVPAEL